MDQFILIFRHQDGNKIASSEQIKEWMEQTHEWIGSIAALNKFVGGAGLLFDDARVVKKNEVSQAAFGEIHETIGGYIIVKAESIDEAVAFAKGCPVLQSEDNSVEVRKMAH